MEIHIEKNSSKNGTMVFDVSFSGGFEISAYQETAMSMVRDIRELSGKPFRVLINFTNVHLMTKEQTQLFLKTQNIAVDMGMEKDAFVTTNHLLKMQFARIAMEGKRFDALGKLEIFDNIEIARQYICE